MQGHTKPTGYEMSEDSDKTEAAPKKGSKSSMIIGLAMAAMAAGGGFYAASNGMILGAKSDAETSAEAPKTAGLDDTATFEFLPLDPVVINLPPGSAHTHFRLVSQLEVNATELGAVSRQMPRILDTMNTYLRALEPSDFEDRIALTRIRTHLLARITTVVGTEKVRDLLIMEFILS